MLPWNAEDLAFDETHFCGTARLFPLPDLVMFPNVMQPLHIFEPRYRDLLSDALDSDGLIAMSVLAPGWESNYEGRPVVLPHVCLGKVVAHQRLPDGRYNLMLLGMRRAKIIGELPANRSFRQAEVEVLDDFYPLDGEADRAEVQTVLTDRFQESLSLSQGAADGPLRELLAADASLGALADLIGFALPLSIELKCELLAECDVDRRAALLLDALGDPLRPRLATPAAMADYPPRFSRN